MYYVKVARTEPVSNVATAQLSATVTAVSCKPNDGLKLPQDFITIFAHMLDASATFYLRELGKSSWLTFKGCILRHLPAMATAAFTTLTRPSSSGFVTRVQLSRHPDVVDNLATHFARRCLSETGGISGSLQQPRPDSTCAQVVTRLCLRTFDIQVLTEDSVWRLGCGLRVRTCARRTMHQKLPVWT